MQLRVERKILVAEGATWWLLKAGEVKSEEQVEAKDRAVWIFFVSCFSQRIWEMNQESIFFVRESL